MNKEPGAEETFKRISNAYEVLSDDQKRSIYDRCACWQTFRPVEFPEGSCAPSRRAASHDHSVAPLGKLPAAEHWRAGSP